MKRWTYIAILLTPLHPPAFAQDAVPGSVLSAPGGRFVLGQLSQFRRDKFLLDTQTGRVWNLICAVSGKDDSSGKCDVTAFEPVLFLDRQGKTTGTTP